MAAIAQLKALLGLDAENYKAGIRQSESATQRFQQSLSRIGSMIGVAFSVGAVVGFTKRLIDFASEIRHTADNLEVATDTLQGLNAMALRYGVSVDQIGRALSKMLIAQDGVTKGEKLYADALRALNIDAETFINLDSGKALEAVGRGYSEAQDKAAAFAAVSDLLGERIGPRLIAMMKDLGNEGLQTVIDKAKEAGTVIEDEMITKLELLGTRNDQIALRIKVAWASILDKVGSATSALGAQFGSIYEEFQQNRGQGGPFDILNNVKAAIDTIRGGGIGRAIEAGANAITPEVAPTPGVPRVRKTLPGATQENAAYQSSMEEYRAMLKADEERARAKADYDKRRAAIETRGGTGGGGSDIRRDQLASVGGLVGASRAGVATADRAFQKMVEDARRQEQLVQLNREQAERLADIESKLPGGVV